MEERNPSQAILDVFRFRHACKKFDPDKQIPDHDFNTILEAARLSPTSFGFEPWKMIVLTDESIRRKLYASAWGARNSLDGAGRFVVLLARKKLDTLYDAEFIAHMMRDIHHLPPDAIRQRRERYRSFQQDDFELLESGRALFDWACKQTYIVLANMMTAAAYLGIDSCPIEGFHRKKADAILTEAGLFDPERFGVSVMGGFGYRAEPPRHEKTRQPLEDLIIWK